MTEAALIFAAGFGTRMRPLTADRPKPLLALRGRTMMDRALDLVAEAGIPHAAANAHYLADQIVDHLTPLGVPVSVERPEILDTGGGLRAALSLLRCDPIFTLNPDAVWLGPNPLTLLRRAWDADAMDGLLMCVPLAQTHGRAGGGDFRLLQDGRVARGGDLVYGGAALQKTAGMSDIPERAFSLNRLWDRMAAEGRLKLARYPGQWCDIGRPENIPLAEALLEHGRV